MTIELIITTVILGVLIIIYKKTNIKFQFDINKKNQASISESEENHSQKISDSISEKSHERSQKELGKNKWLYTADNFGKMKKGRVL